MLKNRSLNTHRENKNNIRGRLAQDLRLIFRHSLYNAPSSVASEQILTLTRTPSTQSQPWRQACTAAAFQSTGRDPKGTNFPHVRSYVERLFLGTSLVAPGIYSS